MANKYRGITWNNAGAGPKVKIRRSIWLAELADFGAITDDPVDLPTKGALHRGSMGATSGTRSYVNLSTVNDLAVVDTQDHGLVTDTATSAAIWKTNSENTNEVTSGTPTQARTHYLRITGASYNTSISTYILDHVDMSSDHPDWTATGMTTDVTLVKVVHAPSNTTLELGDTIPSSTFNLTSNSAYHTWGLDDSAYTNIHAPNGYHISGFTKDSQSSYTRWNIDYDNSQFGARATVLDQLFEGQVISNYENTTWLTFYDADGYKYEFSHHRRSTNGYSDQFEYNGTTQAY